MRVSTSLAASIILFLSLSVTYGSDIETAITVKNSYYETLDIIADRFLKLASAGGIIDKPKQPEEFYHNARIYELRGDYINAKLCYEKYVKFNLNYIDPVTRCSSFFAFKIMTNSLH